MSVRCSSGPRRSWGYSFKRRRRSSCWERSSAASTSATLGRLVGSSPGSGTRSPHHPLHRTPAAFRLAELYGSPAAEGDEFFRSAIKERVAMRTVGFLWVGALALGLMDVPGATGHEEPRKEESAIDLRLARRCFAEARALSQADGGRLWGKPLYGPMLFVDPSSRQIVANQRDGGQTLHGQDGVWVGTLPPQFGIANTAFQWEGVCLDGPVLELPATRDVSCSFDPRPIDVLDQGDGTVWSAGVAICPRGQAGWPRLPRDRWHRDRVLRFITSPHALSCRAYRLSAGGAAPARPRAGPCATPATRRAAPARPRCRPGS
jgi:hypothetical protein